MVALIFSSARDDVLYATSPHSRHPQDSRYYRDIETKTSEESRHNTQLPGSGSLSKLSSLRSSRAARRPRIIRDSSDFYRVTDTLPETFSLSFDNATNAATLELVFSLFFFFLIQTKRIPQASEEPNARTNITLPKEDPIHERRATGTTL